MQEKLTATQNTVVSNQKKAEFREKKIISDYSIKVNEANERADEIEHRCSKDNAAALSAKIQGESFRDEHQRILREQKDEVDKLAEQKICSKVASLKASKESEVHQILNDCKASIQKYKKYYASEYAAKETWHILIFAFCITWLLIQALSSNYFRNEAAVFCTWIKNYVIDSFETISSWMVASANITNGINNEITSNILYWILYVVVGLLSGLLFYGVPVVIILGGFIYLNSKLFDKANRWIMVGSGILFVAMSSEMFYTPNMNLLFLWLLVQVTVPLIRYIIIPLVGSLFDK